MGLFSSSANTKNTEIVCDIGNGNVGVALVEYSPQKSPNIIFSENLRSPQKEVKKIENTISVLKRDLNILLSNVLRQCVLKKIKPSRVTCFYSSPWFISETHILKIKQDEPVTFSESIIKRLLDEGERNFLVKEEKKLNSNEELKLIERRITRIKLNGYQTHNPLHKKASNIEAALFLSAVPKETISQIEESIDRLWHKIPIHHHSFPLASFAMLRNEFNTYNSFLIVNIADNVTDVSLINDEMLLDTFSFPLGKRSVIESIEERCNLDYEIASSVLSMYVKGEIHSEHMERFNKAILATKKDWLTHFENAFNVLTKNTSVPGAVYIIADPKITPLFESIVKNASFGGYSSIEKELAVYPILKDVFDKYITYSSPIYKNFFLETETLYLNLISTKNEKIIDNYILE